jgi:hypothetical protein
MTHFPMKNVMRSEWKSNGHVKKCILASCFIPVAMLRPVQVSLPRSLARARALTLSLSIYLSISLSLSLDIFF